MMGRGVTTKNRIFGKTCTGTGFDKAMHDQWSSFESVIPKNAPSLLNAQNVSIA